jgi:hypothetical protein
MSYPFPSRKKYSAVLCCIVHSLLEHYLEQIAGMHAHMQIFLEGLVSRMQYVGILTVQLQMLSLASEKCRLFFSIEQKLYEFCI